MGPCSFGRLRPGSELGNFPLSCGVQWSFCSLSRLLLFGSIVDCDGRHRDNRAGQLYLPLRQNTYRREQVIKGIGFVCMRARVCVWATKGCSDAGRQTFLELPGNPLATKRGECGAYDALCNRGDEFEEKEWNNPCPQLLLFIASGKDRIEKERIYRRSGLVALFCGCMYHAFEQH